MQLTGAGSVSTTIGVSAADAGELEREYRIVVMHLFPQWRTLSLETDRNGKVWQEPAMLQLKKLRYSAKAHSGETLELFSEDIRAAFRSLR